MVRSQGHNTTEELPHIYVHHKDIEIRQRWK